MLKSVRLCNTVYLILNSSSLLCISEFISLMQIGVSLKENKVVENKVVGSTQFVILIIRLVPGNVVMVAIDMCGKSPITGEWIYGIT